MDELAAWFGPLDAALGTGMDTGTAPGVGPGPGEAKLLLDMGKRVAQDGPQRMFALLTAYALGRALGRAEQAGPGTDPVTFLQAAVAKVMTLLEEPAS